MFKTEAGMKYLQKKRLMMLAKHLRRIKPEAFDMLAWYKTPYTGSECGTAACVGGHACLMPAFKRLGLHLEKPLIGYGRYPKYGTHQDFIALQKFFGLNHFQSRYLFAPRQGGSKEDAAHRIETLIAYPMMDYPGMGEFKYGWM
jgi:hypothetical protein